MLNVVGDHAASHRTLDALLDSDIDAVAASVSAWVHRPEHAILRSELDPVGADRETGAARRMLDLSRPDLDFVALSTGMGVPASRARTVQELATSSPPPPRRPART